MSSSECVQFPFNEPVEIILRSDGEYQPHGERMCFDVAGGREMWLDAGVAWKLQQMGIVPGERFFICKRWSGDRKIAPRWDVWLSPEAEKARAAVERELVDVGSIDTGGYPVGSQAAADYVAQQKIAELRAMTARDRAVVNIPLEEQLRLSRIAVEMPKPTPKPVATASAPAGPPPDDAPHPADVAPTGTMGPQPVRRQNRAAFERIPADQAFAQILNWIRKGLDQANERWSDQAVQDMASTAFIHAGQQGWLAPWGR